MGQRIRNFFQRVRQHARERAILSTEDATMRGGPDKGPMAFDQIHVAPDDPNDFDAACCERLLKTVACRGTKHIDDLRGIAVSLEDFFHGNRERGSIAANVILAPPLDTTAGWYNHLKSIRENDAVHDVLVEITQVEPYADGRLSSWPYSDTVWIYSTLVRETMEQLVAVLEPSEVRDASVGCEGWDLAPPLAAPPGFKAYWIWWD